MTTSQQQWRRGSRLLLLAAAVALVLLIAAGSADAKCSGYGYSDCNGKCVDLKTDPYNCKYCDYACKKYPHTTPKCQYGVCKWVCDYLYGDCDHNIKNGCETYLGDDVYNCNYCGHVCKLSPYYKYGQVYCIKGVCKSGCKPGWKYNSSGKYCYKS